MKRLLIFILCTVCCAMGFAQSKNKITITPARQVMSQPYRQSLPDSVNQLLSQLDSLLTLDSTLRFRTVGEAGKLSPAFQIYARLIKTATQPQLLSMLSCPTEHPVIRGYAYMAYAFLCQRQHKPEAPLNYNFTLHTLNGCEAFTMPFSQFKTYCKKRNAFNPTATAINPQEKQVLKSENKIRTEQNLPQTKK